MSRRWSIAAIVVLGLALSAGLLWWELPGIVRWLVVRQLEATAGRRVTIERFELDLQRGRLGIGGLRVADREPGPPLAEIDRLDARFKPGSLIRGHFHVYEAAVDGVRVRIVRTERGELNIADLLSRPSGEGPQAVTVDRFALTAGALTLDDRAQSPPRTWRAEAITVEASALSTVSPEAQGSLRLTAAVAGAPLAVDVSSLGLAPLRARARVSVQGVDATLSQLYLPPGVPVVLERARFTADLTAALDAGALALDGRGALEDVVFRRQGADAPLGTVPKLEFTIDGAVIQGQATRIRRLEATGNAMLLDQRTSPATQYPIHRLRWSVETPDPAAPARVSFIAARQGGGELAVEGTARFAPLSAELRARATRIDLAAWDALIPLPGRLSGFAESDLTIAISASASGVAARVRGRAGASRLAVADRDEPLIAAQDIEVTGVDAEWPRLRVERIRAVRPTVAVERDAEGRLALLALVAPAGPPRPGTRAAEAPAGIAVEVGEIVMSEGTVTLDDAAVAPRARLRFSPVSLSVRDVAWPGNRPAKVELKAAMPITGTFEATGTATLEPVKVELRARLAGAALGPYQTYVPLAARIRGRLDADVTVSGALEPRVDVGVRGTAGVRELTIGERDRPLITVARIDMAGLDYKWPTTVAVDRLRVERSWAMLERRADGSFPLAALFRPLPGAGATAPGPAAPPSVFDVVVRESLLEGGAVTVVDGGVTPPARVEVAGARLEARDFTWPARRPVPLEIHVPMPGGGNVSGQGQLGVGSRSLEVKVVLTGVDAAPAQPYLPVRGRISGKVSADLQVKVSLEPFAIAAQGKAGLQDVTLGDGDRPLVTAARIETTGVSYTWPATAKVDRLVIDKPSVTLERRPDGTLPLLALLAPSRAFAGVAQPAAATPMAIDVAVRETVLSAGSASIVDRVVSPAAQVDLSDLQVTARDVAWPARAPIPVRIGAAVPGGGSVHAEGQFAADTSRIDVKLAVRDVALATVHPYLPLRGTVTGKAGGDFEVQATIDPLAITARGTASASDLIVSEGARPLVKAQRAEVAGIGYTWPAKVQVDRLRVQGSWVAIERGRDGGLTLGSLLAPAKESAPAVARPGVASSTPSSALVSPEVVVRQSVFEDAAATIVDAGVSPATRVEIANARLSVRNLRWPSGRAAAIDLSAPMPGGGKIEASGRLRADASSVDLKLSFQQADLAVLAPYLPVKARVNGKMDGAVTVKGSLSPLAVAVTGDVTLLWVVVADGQRMVAYVKQADLAGVQADWPRRVSVERVRILEPWALVEREPDSTVPLLSLIALHEPAAVLDRGSGGGPAAPSPSPAIDIGTAIAIVEEGFIRFVDRTTTPAFVEEISRINSTARTARHGARHAKSVHAHRQADRWGSVRLRGRGRPAAGPAQARSAGQAHQPGAQPPQSVPQAVFRLGRAPGCAQRHRRLPRRERPPRRRERRRGVIAGHRSLPPGREGARARRRACRHARVVAQGRARRGEDVLSRHGGRQRTPVRLRRRGVGGRAEDSDQRAGAARELGRQDLLHGRRADRHDPDLARHFRAGVHAGAPRHRRAGRAAGDVLARRAGHRPHAEARHDRGRRRDAHARGGEEAPRCPRARIG